MKAQSTGSAKADGGGLIPDLVTSPEKLEQHDHVDRVQGCIHTAAEDGPDVVARAPVQRQSNADLLPIRRNVLDPGSGRSIGREPVEPPTAQPSLPRFRHFVAPHAEVWDASPFETRGLTFCLLYTSDAADDLL